MNEIQTAPKIKAAPGTTFKIHVTATHVHSATICGRPDKNTLDRYLNAVQDATDAQDVISLLEDEGATVINFDGTGVRIDSFVELAEIDECTP